MRINVTVGVLLLLLSGCHSQPYPNVPLPEKPQPADTVGMAALSYGAIKKHLKVGTSTQTDVIKLLGSPNNLTMTSNGNEVWVYDRISTQSSTVGSSSSAGGFIGIGGVSGNAAGGIGAGGSSSDSQSTLVSSTKTLTIILEFKNDVLVDLIAREGRY